MFLIWAPGTYCISMVQPTQPTLYKVGWVFFAQIYMILNSLKL